MYESPLADRLRKRDDGASSDPLGGLNTTANNGVQERLDPGLSIRPSGAASTSEQAAELAEPRSPERCANDAVFSTSQAPGAGL